MLKNRNFFTLFPAIFFLTIIAIGLIVSIFSLRSLNQKEWADLTQPRKIINGESTQKFIKLLNQNFALSSTFSQIEHAILWNLTGDLGTSVRAGCDDWLFLTDEFQVYADRNAAAQERANLIASVNQELASQGIHLLVVVVPDKARIANTHLCSLKRSPVLQQRVQNWVANLKQNNIQALDLTNLLASSSVASYYHTDTHWNEIGANLSALAIAETLRNLNWETSQAADFQLQTALSARSGDLIHLAGLDHLPRYLRPKIELASITQVPPLQIESDDLFGDSALPTTVLLGTSYSRNSNFSAFLEHHLGQNLVNFAKDGGGFSGAAWAYFASAAYQETPPHTVIWEIPERVLEAPVTEQERHGFALKISKVNTTH